MVGCVDRHGTCWTSAKIWNIQKWISKLTCQRSSYGTSERPGKNETSRCWQHPYSIKCSSLLIFICFRLEELLLQEIRFGAKFKHWYRPNHCVDVPSYPRLLFPARRRSSSFDCKLAVNYSARGKGDPAVTCLASLPINIGFSNLVTAARYANNLVI